MQNKTFRLFISSPFSDFTKEREVLHKRVFPKIEEYCNQHHLSFQPVDLRWGVNEEAQLDQKTLEVCLEEVRACKHFPHPNFLIMAGDRYGYVPCPYMIEKSEFEDIYNYVKDNNKAIIEIEYWEHNKEKYPKVYGEGAEGKVTAPNRITNYIELLEQWYQLDENQLPASYILQERTDDNSYGNYLIYENWAPEENTLRDILQEAADHIFKSKESKEYQKYFLSATEQEVIEGIYDYKYKTDAQKDRDGAIDKKYIFGYTRSIKKIDDSEDNQIYLDRQNKKSVPELKVKADKFKTDLQKLLKDNVLPSSFTSVKEYKDNELKEFEEYIVEKLKRAIKEQLPKTENLTKQEEQKLKLEQEISEQTKFLKDKVKGFQGREKTLDAIDNYLKVDTTEPLAIYGPSGMGKSSLMAKVIKSTKTDSTIFRFVGATENSTTIRNLLISIVDELQDKKIIDKIDEYEADENKFDTQIKEILHSIKEKSTEAKTTVTIFIDALDQLQYKNYLNWLPGKLPPNLKIILTVLNDEKYIEDTHYYNLLTERYDNTKFIDITKDSLEEKKEKLIKDLLEVEHRKLNKVQKDYLLKKWASVVYSPLYLKIAIEEVKHWKHCEDKDGNPIRCEKQKLEDGVEGIIAEYLKNLDKLYHHEALLINKVFGYIHTSKDGLSEKELLQILSEDLEDDEAFRDVIINEYHEAIKVANLRRDNNEEYILPISIWSRLHTQIKPFIIERNIDGQPLMKFFHRQFTSVVEELYTEYEKEALHIRLADYFLTLQDTTKIWDERYNNLHMLDELPYHLFHSKNSEKLKEILFDLEFAGSVYDHHKQDTFREILEKATELDGITEKEIYPWESFYREKEHFITKVDEKLWKPRQSLFQLAYEDGNNSFLSQEAGRLLEKDRVNFMWLKNKNKDEVYRRSGLLKVLKGHTRGILGTKVMSDGRILSSSEDKTLRLWSSEGKPLTVLNGHTGSVNGAEILSDGRILSYSYDKTLRLWSSEGEPLAILEGHSDTISGVKILNDGRILSYARDKTLRLWSMQGEPLSVLEEHTGSVNGAEILSDGRILSYSEDKTLRLWSMQGELLSVLQGHTGSVNGAEILSDGRILSYSEDKTLRLWSMQGELLSVLQGHTSNVNGAEILSDGRILSYSYDKTLRLWSSEGEPMAILAGHSDPVSGVKILNDGRILSYAGNVLSEDVTLRLWSSEGEPLTVLKGHTGSVNGAEILSDGRILSYSYDKTLRLWSSEGEPLAILAGHSDTISGVKILNDGRILSYARDKTLRLWNSEESDLEISEGHSDSVSGIEILNDGRILSSSEDKTLRLWSSEGKPLIVLNGHTGSVNGAEILSDGRILSYSYDKTLRLWSSEGEPLAILEGHSDTISGVKILNDGRILSYARDKTLRLWSMQGELLSVLQGHTGSVNGAEILSDGRILSYSEDKTLRLWSMQGELLSVLQGHTGSVNGAEILSDGRILSYSYDKTLRLWSSEGEPMAILAGHSDPVSGVKILNDGRILSYTRENTSLGFWERRILTYTREDTLRLWSMEGEHLSVLQGHTHSVKGIEILSDGRILSYAMDDTLRLWGSEGESLAVMVGHTGSILGVEIFNDGRTLSYSYDKTLRVWNSEGQELYLLNLTVEELTSYNIKEEFLIVSTDKYILSYDLYIGNKKISFSGMTE